MGGLTTLGTDAGWAAAFGGSATSLGSSGADFAGSTTDLFIDRAAADGALELSSSCGNTFLTTRRTTFTTFFRVKPWSSVSSGWLALTGLTVPLSVPLALLSPLSTGSEPVDTLAASGLRKRSGILGGSALLSDVGLGLLGEGLLILSLPCGCGCGCACACV